MIASQDRPIVPRAQINGHVHGDRTSSSHQTNSTSTNHTQKKAISQNTTVSEDDRDETTTATTTTTSVAHTTAASTSILSKQQSTSDEEIYYAPMTDSEPEDNAPLPGPTSQNWGASAAAQQAIADMLRSPSVSYIDPTIDLAEEQDRSHFMDFDLPELNGSDTPIAGIDEPSDDPSATIPVSMLDTQTGPLVLQDAANTRETSPTVKREHRVRAGTPPSSAEKGKARMTEPSTPNDRGWGISAQPSPSQAATYDEEDELDELGDPSPRQSTPRASSSIFRAPNAIVPSTHAGGSTSTPDKGKGRARDDDDDNDPLPTPSNTASTARTDNAPMYFEEEVDEPNTPSSRDKGKERAREFGTPPLTNINATPSTVTQTSPRVSRPATLRRKYRGLQRFKQAACLALDRTEPYLDIALEDEGRTCWVRCINWDVPSDGEREEEQGDEEVETAEVAAVSSVTAPRIRRRPAFRAHAQTQTITHRSQGKITCGAEVLGELVDDDIEADKWRVIRLDNEHSTACEMLIKQMKANEILERAHIDIQAEDDPELAEDILAATWQDDLQQSMQADEDDPELSQAILESLEEARQMELDEHFTRMINDEGPVPNGEQHHADANAEAGPSGSRHKNMHANDHAVDDSGDEDTADVRTVAPNVHADHYEVDDSGKYVHAQSTAAPLERQPSADATATSTERPTLQPNNSGPGIFRRLYETFSPNRALPSDACRTGKTFDSKDECLDAVATALSLQRRQIFARVGMRDGAPFVDAFCPCNKDLTDDERHAVRRANTNVNDCTAQVNAYYKDAVGPW